MSKHLANKAGRAKGAEKLRRLEFILRRACWYGRVTIRDVQEAFGVTRQIAGLDLVELKRCNTGQRSVQTEVCFPSLCAEPVQLPQSTPSVHTSRRVL